MAPGFGRVITSLPVRIICGALGLFLLGVAIYSGFEGTEAPDRNVTLTLLFVTAWLGFPVLEVLIGNLFPAFNPWNAVAAPVGWAWRKVTGAAPRHLQYPASLGRWPAAIALFLFVWMELVYGEGSGVAVGVSPESVAQAAVFYSIYTLVMVGLFGRETWFRNGEVFSVYFGMFGTLGKFEVRGRELGIRRFLSGASSWVAGIHGSVALVICSIGTTTFDGASEGVFKNGIQWLIDRCADIGLNPTASVRTSMTIFMLLSIAIVALVYLAGVRGMSTVPGAPDRWTLWRTFAHALIPIAFAYLLAHYFSLFFFQEQAQFTYLLSDPLGTGTTDLFGTASYGVDYNAISNQLVWYVQVGALVCGHVAGLVLAHDRAITIWKDYRIAARSQYWMLAVMVAFTCFGLFLLSVSNQ
ncbi:MAG: fenitrothion hydrolase [Solirubrobacterales bacterium]|nr:fenitrothion hydrolase [Solirubrobacterales bacterium]MCB8916074.1 fenitrothion hydrolase [Thermoleophilales bacterium]